MNSFIINSSSIAIGDPVLGMISVPFPISGEFIIEKGGLISPIQKQPIIDLDNPGLFVLDGDYLEKFEDWFHSIGQETGYDLLQLSERIEEFKLTKAAFYWEEALASENREGQYTLDISFIKSV